jgi:chemotaxis receptor (MCP) glutamine deamidase CheD
VSERPGDAVVRPPVDPLTQVTIYIGGVHASREPVVVRTLLGSCIAVCLWDPEGQIGGMNHFLLPTGEGAAHESARFGVHAMDRLIGAMMKLGADRRRVVAKVFGGAHVLDVVESPLGVPQRNVAFIREFLDHDGIPMVAEDLGGRQPRDVRFFTASGRVRLRRIGGVRTQDRLVRVERRAEVATPATGTVELWD